MATTKAGKKALWIAQFLTALEYRLLGQQVGPRADNREAILLTTNLEFYWYTKHIEVQYYQIWEKVESKEIVITYISTKDMVADGLIKTLNSKPSKGF